MVQNIANAIRQSKKARHTHVSVTDIIFAMSGGIVLLSMDSMLAQSAIIFVVISEVFCVKKAHRKPS